MAKTPTAAEIKAERFLKDDGNWLLVDPTQTAQVGEQAIEACQDIRAFKEKRSDFDIARKFFARTIVIQEPSELDFDVLARTITNANNGRFREDCFLSTSEPGEGGTVYTVFIAEEAMEKVRGQLSRARD